MNPIKRQPVLIRPCPPVCDPRRQKQHLILFDSVVSPINLNVKALLTEQKIKIQDLENYHSCCDSVSFGDGF